MKLSRKNLRPVFRKWPTPLLKSAMLVAYVVTAPFFALSCLFNRNTVQEMIQECANMLFAEVTE